MVVLVALLALIALFYGFMTSRRFGAFARGERLARMQASPNYRNGQFQNQSPTPDFTDGNFFTAMRSYFTEKTRRNRPERALPSVKIDLKTLAPERDLLVWFGHSSYFLQVHGTRFLVDPVFCGNASPFRFNNRSFPGSDQYTVDDLPPIDVVLLTHDHWDHLDYRTLEALRGKAGRVITGLGNGAHLERWGWEAGRIHELDWNESVELPGEVGIQAVPARHFSGRGFRRNGVLWVSFVLTTPSRRIFIGGDSGYDRHFRAVGEAWGGFDLAILECGQYNRYWKHIHLMPEEVVQAARDLRADLLLPVHWGKFAMSVHDWDEPIERVVAAAREVGLPLVHPRIGEALDLDGEPETRAWWKESRTGYKI